MKKYKCDKIVEAGEIASFEGPDIVLKDGERVGMNFKERTRIGAMAAGATPASGMGYLVRYEDGYLSWSPKAVFEAGYAEISE